VTGFRYKYPRHRRNCLKDPNLKREYNRKEYNCKEYNRKEYTCKECDKTFPSSSHFNRHMIFHSKAKNFQCTDCEKAYADKNNLKNHVRLLHPDSAQQFEKERKRPCNLCDKRFETHTKVELHKIEEHGHTYFACCDVCGKGFIKRDYRGRLQYHKKKCPSTLSLPAKHSVHLNRWAPSLIQEGRTM